MTHFVSILLVGGSLNGKAAKVYLVSCGFKSRPLKTFFISILRTLKNCDLILRIFDVPWKLITIQLISEQFLSKILKIVLKNFLIIILTMTMNGISYLENKTISYLDEILSSAQRRSMMKNFVFQKICFCFGSYLSRSEETSSFPIQFLTIK